MDEAQRARLAAWLSAAAGTPVVLREMALLSGGAVQQNWALDVTRDGQPERWVLRTDNAAVLSVSLPRTAEYALLRAADLALRMAGEGKPRHDYAQGQRVRHGEYGEGVIAGISGSGPRSIGTVIFDGPAGTRKFILGHGALEPLGE